MDSSSSLGLAARGLMLDVGEPMCKEAAIPKFLMKRMLGMARAGGEAWAKAREVALLDHWRKQFKSMMVHRVRGLEAMRGDSLNFVPTLDRPMGQTPVRSLTAGEAKRIVKGIANEEIPVYDVFGDSFPRMYINGSTRKTDSLISLLASPFLDWKQYELLNRVTNRAAHRYFRNNANLEGQLEKDVVGRFVQDRKAGADPSVLRTDGSGYVRTPFMLRDIGSVVPYKSTPDRLLNESLESQAPSLFRDAEESAGALKRLYKYRMLRSYGLSRSDAELLSRTGEGDAGLTVAHIRPSVPYVSTPHIANSTTSMDLQNRLRAGAVSGNGTLEGTRTFWGRRRAHYGVVNPDGGALPGFGRMESARDRARMDLSNNFETVTDPVLRDNSRLMSLYVGSPEGTATMADIASRGRHGDLFRGHASLSDVMEYFSPARTGVYASQFPTQALRWGTTGYYDNMNALFREVVPQGPANFDRISRYRGDSMRAAAWRLARGRATEAANSYMAGGGVFNGLSTKTMPNGRVKWKLPSGLSDIQRRDVYRMANAEFNPNVLWRRGRRTSLPPYAIGSQSVPRRLASALNNRFLDGTIRS